MAPYTATVNAQLDKKQSHSCMLLVYQRLSCVHHIQSHKLTQQHTYLGPYFHKSNFVRAVERDTMVQRTLNIISMRTYNNQQPLVIKER